VNFGFLLRAWLKQQAQARLRESLAQATAGAHADGGYERPPRARGANEEPAGRRGTQKESAGETTARDPGEEEPRERVALATHAVPPQPRPCDVGLVFALPIEMGGWEDLLEGVVSTHARDCLVRQGGYRGRSIAMVCSDAGQQAAVRATQALIAGHRPRWVISAGFAGGLRADVRRGDIVMADRVSDISGRGLAIDLKVDPQAVAQTAGLHVGRILTMDKIVVRPEEKRALGEAHDALCVDMESWAVGEVCRQDKVRFMAIRVISDGVDDELPREIDNLLVQKSRAGTWGAVAGALWRRPSSLKDMLRLKRDALANSDRLARFLGQVVVQLTPQSA
jgi:adenosylhomocysteine nucleosidase